MKKPLLFCSQTHDAYRINGKPAPRNHRQTIAIAPRCSTRIMRDLVSLRARLGTIEKWSPIWVYFRGETAYRFRPKGGYWGAPGAGTAELSPVPTIPTHQLCLVGLLGGCFCWFTRVRRDNYAMTRYA